VVLQSDFVYGGDAGLCEISVSKLGRRCGKGFVFSQRNARSNVVRLRDRDCVLQWGPFSFLCSHQGVLWHYGFTSLILARIVYASP